MNQFFVQYVIQIFHIKVMAYISLESRLIALETNLRNISKQDLNIMSDNQIVQIFKALQKSYADVHNKEAVNKLMISMRFDVKKILDKLSITPRRPIFQSVLDTVIREFFGVHNQRGVTWSTWIQNHLAYVFLQFIQGITMFETRDGSIPKENIGRPVYHRITSCGEWKRGQDEKISEAHETNHMKCNPDLAVEELERTRQNSWTCLIERLIYDELYRYYMGEDQDLQHASNELRVARKLFESCFSTLHVFIQDVKVTFNNEQMPIALRIIYEISEMSETFGSQSNIYTITEQYTKESNTNKYKIPVMIHCKKEVRPLSRSGPGDEYTKVQSYFTGSQEWLLTNPGPAPVRGGSNKNQVNCKVIDPWVG